MAAVLPTGLKEVYKEFSGVSSYSTGGDNYTVDELNKIEAAVIYPISGHVNAGGDLHYLPELSTDLPTPNNVLKIKMFKVSAGIIDEVPSATNLASIKLGAYLEGS